MNNNMHVINEIWQQAHRKRWAPGSNELCLNKTRREVGILTWGHRRPVSVDNKVRTGHRRMHGESKHWLERKCCEVWNWTTRVPRVATKRCLSRDLVNVQKQMEMTFTHLEIGKKKKNREDQVCNRLTVPQGSHGGPTLNLPRVSLPVSTCNLMTALCVCTAALCLRYSLFQMLNTNNLLWLHKHPTLHLMLQLLHTSVSRMEGL